MKNLKLGVKLLGGFLAVAFIVAAVGGGRVAIHVGETRDELELLVHHRGPFVDFLKEVGVWDPDGLVSGVDFLSSLRNNFV